MTARILSVSVMLTAALGLGLGLSLAAGGATPANAKSANTKSAAPAKAAPACVCAPAPARRSVRHAVRRGAASQAYAERFYNYWQARPVLMTGWHGEWQQAPNDWVAPAAYAGGYEQGGYAGGGYEQGGYEGGGGEEPGLAIDRNGWSGGVGGYAAEGGGGGGVGLAIIAQGGGGLNGPTYNDYGQSFQYNPSQAGPFRNRLMGGFAPPPKSSGGGGSK